MYRAEAAILAQLHLSNDLTPQEVIDKLTDPLQDFTAKRLQQAYWELLHDKRIVLHKDIRLTLPDSKITLV